MTGAKASAARAIADARALLAAMLANGWSEIQVVSGDTEILIASDAGRANPVAGRGEGRQALGAPNMRYMVVAPNVATLVVVLAAGTSVTAGDALATLELLGVEFRIFADRAGSVDEVYVVPGDLLEFGTQILAVVAASPTD